MPYNPSSDVVEKNEALTFALQAAPMVLLERFQQFGELGTLGWCSEFSDLVDEIKALGFDGDMFTTTRETALKSCADILALNLDVKMQLVTLFLVRKFSYNPPSRCYHCLIPPHNLIPPHVCISDAHLSSFFRDIVLPDCQASTLPRWRK